MGVVAGVAVQGTEDHSSAVCNAAEQKFVKSYSGSNRECRLHTNNTNESCDGAHIYTV